MPTGSASAYYSLSSLGAPVTLEEFTRLYNGPLADALQFLSEHVVGRQEAAAARTTLFLAQQERSKSNLKQPGTTRSSGDKAVARLSGAKKSSAVYTGQLMDLEAKCHAAQAQVDNLQKQLDHKRKLLLLLQVLEAKQNLRTKRIEEMTRLVVGLRGTVHQSQKQIVSFANPPDVQVTKAQYCRVSNTRDAMADLHSYAIRLSQLVASPASGNGTLRLQRSIARSLGPDHPDAARAFDRCVSHARRLGDQSLQLVRQSGASNIRDLEAKKRANQEKEVKLQKLADLSIALRLLCDRHLTSIVEFTGTSPHPLRRSLQEESRLSKGHVDIARSLIVSDRLVEPRENSSFLAQVAQVCHLHGNVRVRTLLDEIERVIRHTHRRFNLVDPGRLPRPGAVDKALIDDYRSNAETAHDRATKLLTRKAEKAVMGQSLACEVEALLRETHLALGLPTND
ncbi:hypothetical protein FB451DRAFT_1224690 [Mycena latifolia]|nr:hypothetical protein FB451DRAFT_1224690 [Mycena latifolia]